MPIRIKQNTHADISLTKPLPAQRRSRSQQIARKPSVWQQDNNFPALQKLGKYRSNLLKKGGKAIATGIKNVPEPKGLRLYSNFSKAKILAGIKNVPEPKGLRLLHKEGKECLVWNKKRP